MVSLKMSAKEQKEYSSGAVCAPGGDAPLYSYGTELCLNDELLAKLGVTELPKVGTKFAVIGIAEVIDTSARENKKGYEQSLSLQMTDMQLNVAEKSNDERAKKLYPDQD